MDHNEDIDKEIRLSLSIFWDIAVQGGNEVMRYLSNSFIYGVVSIKSSLFLYSLNSVREHATKNTRLFNFAAVFTIFTFQAPATNIYSF